MMISDCRKNADYYKIYLIKVAQVRDDVKSGWQQLVRLQQFPAVFQLLKYFLDPISVSFI